MGYIFTDHAALRMRQRDITRRQVKETIEQPEESWRDKEMKDRHIHVRTYERGRLKVIWTLENYDAYIVTAVWLEEGGKT